MASTIAVVTGSSGSIGHAICQRLGDAGHRVVGLDIKPGDAVETLLCDLGSPDEIRASFARIEQQYGPAAILVNNAGISLRRSFFDCTPQDYETSMAINCRAAFFCAQAAARQMLETGGSIVSIASVVAQTGGIYVDYSAAKAAIIGMTKSLAIVLAPHNIRVNAVAPGAVETAMLVGMDPELRRHFETRTLLKRMAASDEIASVVAFLCSQGSSYMTGAVVDVNGGVN